MSLLLLLGGGGVSFYSGGRGPKGTVDAKPPRPPKIKRPKPVGSVR